MAFPVTARTRRICDLYREAIERGEDEGSVVGELAAMHDILRPAIWKALRSGGVLPPYRTKREGGDGRPLGGGVAGFTERRATASAGWKARREASMPEPVFRDPCPMCEVRADIGCRHRPRQVMP